MADLSLAAYSASIETSALLWQIISTARQALRLKKECQKIETVASLLNNIIAQRQRAVDGSTTAPKLEDLLGKVLAYVRQCQHSRRSQAWEVLWRRRLPVLTKNMLVWVTYLNMETVVDSRDDILRLLDNDEHDAVQDSERHNEVIAKLNILDELKQHAAEKLPASLAVDFNESDPRLVLTTVSGDRLVGTLRLLPDDKDGAASPVPVVCEPVKEELMRYGEKGPRHVSIYSKLSARILVHPFYGIAKHGGTRWTVFRDMSSHPTLADAVAHRMLPNKLSDRVAIALEIALTLSYLHSVEIVLKRLSDRTVVLVEEHGRLVPYLLQLEHARLFQESTGGSKYDLRYQAPSLWQTSRRTDRTDVWSLGVIIWQLVTAEFPFDISAEVTSDGPDAEAIAARVREHDYPWKSRGPSLSSSDRPAVYLEVMNVVRSCCDEKNPSVQPSADNVAHALQAILSSSSPSTAAVPVAAPESADNALIRNTLGAVEQRQQAGGGGGGGGRPAANQPSSSPPPEPAASAPLSDEDAARLRRLTADGNTNAADLLASCIWLRLVEPTYEESEPGQILLVGGVDHALETRCRAAIRLWEFALQGGVKGAAKPLSNAYHQLAKLCKTQAEQLKVLPKRDERNPTSRPPTTGPPRES